MLHGSFAFRQILKALTSSGQAQKMKISTMAMSRMPSTIHRIGRFVFIVLNRLLGIRAAVFGLAPGQAQHEHGCQRQKCQGFSGSSHSHENLLHSEFVLIMRKNRFRFKRHRENCS